MRAVSALLSGTCAGVWLALLFAFVQGGLTPGAAIISLAAGAVLLSWMLSRRSPEPAAPSLPPGPWEWVSILLYTLCSARAFLWLVTVQTDEIKVLSPNNLGDMSLHLTYIHYLARGAHFWPDNPIFAGGKLTYPVGVDLFNSLLALAGVDTLRGLVAVGLIGAALTGLALWRWGRGIALITFLGNGGLAAFIAFFQDRAISDFQGTLAWKSIFLSLFVTQRGLLFALPAGLLLLASWRARFFGKEESGRLPLWTEVLLYASMPLFHLHTFLFLSLLLGAWFVFQPQLRRNLLHLVLPSIVPASLLVFFVTGMMKGASVIGLKIGWMWDDQGWLDWATKYLPVQLFTPTLLSMILTIVVFWVINFGFALGLVGWFLWSIRVPGFSDRLRKAVLPGVGILLLLLCHFGTFGPMAWLNSKASIFLTVALIGWFCWSIRTAEPPAWPRALLWPALGIFVLCCLVKFAVWEWDNTKIMIWSYLAILPLAWNELLAHRPQIVRAIACVLLFGSGLASVIGGIDSRHQGHGIAARSELDGVFKAVAAISVEERFVAYPTYNHPLLIAGRKVALGYIGHAWSHGLNYRPTELRVTSLMNGEPTWREDAAALQVRYLFWGREEAEHYPASTKPWLSLATPIATGEWGTIYDLQAAP